MKIGIIGLGQIGSAVVKHLLNAGHSVKGYDLHPKPELEQLGFQFCQDLEHTIEDIDLIITALPAPKHISQVMEVNGLLSKLANRPNTIWMDHTSTDPDEARRFAELTRNLKIDYLEAPLTGGLTLLQQGLMTVYIGGSDAIYQRIKPVLDAYTTAQIYLGTWGNPATVKIISNMMCAANTAMIGEAMSVFAKSGIDLGKGFEAIRVSAGNTYVWETEAPLAMNGSFDPGFSLQLHNKDLTIGENICKTLEVKAPVFDTATQVYRDAMEKYGPSVGSSHPAKLIAEQSQTDLSYPGFENWTYTTKHREGSIVVLHRDRISTSAPTAAAAGEPSTNNFGTATIPSPPLPP